MRRTTFLKLAGALQMAWGLFFIFRGGDVIAWFIVGPCTSTRLFPTGLGIFVMAFGLLSWFSAGSAPGPAMRAVLFTSLFYLIASMAVDACWIIQGVLTSWTWASIGMRGITAGGYAYYGWRDKDRVVENRAGAHQQTD